MLIQEDRYDLIDPVVAAVDLNKEIDGWMVCSKSSAVCFIPHAREIRVSAASLIFQQSCRTTLVTVALLLWIILGHEGGAILIYTWEMTACPGYPAGSRSRPIYISQHPKQTWRFVLFLEWASCKPLPKQ